MKSILSAGALALALLVLPACSGNKSQEVAPQATIEQSGETKALETPAAPTEAAVDQNAPVAKEDLK